MKISYNWLKQYLNFDLSPDELSLLLTDCGLEVESMEKWQSIKGGLEGLITGEVLTCVKHPDADRLSVTTVNVGKSEPLHIVCGAPNVASGQKVVVATVGTTLYSGEDSFEIKKTKIRGEVSEGMICAEDEIGLGESHDGIMVLDENVKPGTPASEYFNIENDIVYEIGLTPNRTDAMSHIGVARDIKAVLDTQNYINDIKETGNLLIPSVEDFTPDNKDLEIPVEIKNPEACPRYSGVTLTNIEVKESPGWLQNRLNAIGLRPINNIVDITNYVLHETGQPLHAFNADKITGKKVVVRKMEEGTPFVTLDEIERKLSADDLMICNAEDGMCIGGVFGGLTSGVTEKTTKIFLESAWFDPVHIRKTSKRHDLQTDASFRFERGIDPEKVIYALKRAALLMKEITGAKISSEVTDVYPEPYKPVQVKVSYDHIDRLIGKAIGKDTIKKILSFLEFTIENETENGLTLTVPPYRVDVTREADVIEEILRIYGYNNVEIPVRQLSAVSHKPKPDNEKLVNDAAAFLSNNGFYEIMNNSLTRGRYYENQPAFSENESVKMLNPLSRDLNVMRQSLVFGGLETILYNINRKNENLKLFEFGRHYSKINDQNPEAPVTEKYAEAPMLALFLTGNNSAESWYKEQGRSDVFQLKNICLNLLKKFGIDESSLQLSDEEDPLFNQSIRYHSKNKTVLKLGEIADKLRKDFDIHQPVFYAEINWESLMRLVSQSSVSFSPLPKFPEVRRDLALLLDKKVTWDEVQKLAFESERKLLKKV
ncbi:MAG: phenylalanine--tRNA ligase subunit beta, partial [Bacteroidales bacterium]|nr:phenylalanine--tRNA ligase subunit beta [Bacteroidales bacterium]